MKRFLYFTTKIYHSDDYKGYFDSLNKSDKPEEWEQWSDSLSDDEPEQKAPKSYTSRVAIDPDLIIAYVESYSLEAFMQNKENPKFDMIEIMLADGLNIPVISTLDEFERKLLALNA